MLGVKSYHGPIRGEVAQEVRDSLRRLQTGELNETDIRRKEFLGSKREYNITWK